MKTHYRSALLCLVLLLAAAPLSGHVPQRVLMAGGQIAGLKWAPSSVITWRLNAVRGPNVVGGGDLGNAIRQAFQTWSAIPTASLPIAEGQTTAGAVKPGLDQVNLITTNLTPGEWASYGVDALSLTTVFSSVTTGQILEADILFNPNVTFTTDVTTPQVLPDLQAVATHEIGHLLGLDHSPLPSAAMFPLSAGSSTSRALTADDTIGISVLYPSPAFAGRGVIEGTVRTTSNTAVFGAIVVAVGQNGQPFSATITDPDGKYALTGLPAGYYTLFAEPMDGPFLQNSLLVPLALLYPSKTVNTGFTTRFR